MVTAKTPPERKKNPQPSPILDPKRSEEEPSKTAMADEGKLDKKEKKNKKRKSPNEIDAIFQGVKAKKKLESKPEELEGDKKHKKAKDSGLKTKTKNKRGTVAGEAPEARTPRRRTADGLAIYSAKELGFGNPEAGDTPLCPFDCSCCF